MKVLIGQVPAKAKKIQSYLGDEYEVLASFGHIRDLPERDLGIDLGTFDASYLVLERKKGTVAKLRAAIKRAEQVYLATDPDREGEAIAWHIAQELGLQRYSRVTFNEITPKAIPSAIEAGRRLDQKLVDAQQTRRLLDRLVGFKVSPLLSALGQNHSAGRVQSAALHLVVEREKARERFKPENYWTLSASYSNGLRSRFASVDEQGELADTRLPTAEAAQSVVRRASGLHVVTSVEKKPVERRAPAPFTTNTLQQSAGKVLSFSIDRTMELAQSLFESGHISYHRTDSVTLSADAVEMARAFLATDYPAGLPERPNVFRSKLGAQEAHEAIRPTALDPTGPVGLSSDEKALYDLITTRFLASQCKPAVFAQTAVLLTSGDTHWRARGSVLEFKGWMQYLSSESERAEEDSEDRADTHLPNVHVGQELALVKIHVEEKQTKAPPRFTLLGLAGEMERTGIGRPSTIPTIAGESGVLLSRDYVALDAKKFIYPTLRGRTVDELLQESFGMLVKTAYTREMEEHLDAIAEGKKQFKLVLRDWWTAFSTQLARAPELIAAQVAKHPDWVEPAADLSKPTGKKCPQCGKELLLRRGINGAFLGCSGWRDTPSCKYSADPSAVRSRKPCMRCGGDTEETNGKHGRYIRCLKPDCGYSGATDARSSLTPCPKCGMSMEDTRGPSGPYARCLTKDCGTRVDQSPPVEEPCPVCSGPMKRRGAFLSCATYPQCRGSWDLRALAQAKKANRHCPQCKERLLRHVDGPKGAFIGCSGFPKCTYAESLHRPAQLREKPWPKSA